MSARLYWCIYLNVIFLVVDFPFVSLQVISNWTEEIWKG